jgi:hypothetical protein
LILGLGQQCLVRVFLILSKPRRAFFVALLLATYRSGFLSERPYNLSCLFLLPVFQDESFSLKHNFSSYAQNHKIGPTEWRNTFRNTQPSNDVHLLSKHFIPSKASSLIFPQYSITAPIARIAPDMTAAHWSTDRLFQNFDKKDRERAELAATIKIWLIILAFPVVILATINVSVVEIISTRQRALFHVSQALSWVAGTAIRYSKGRNTLRQFQD